MVFVLRFEKFPTNNRFVEGGLEIGSCISAINSMASSTRPGSWSSGSDPDMAVRKMMSMAASFVSKFDSFDQKLRSTPETKKLYIPTLRSLRDLGILIRFMIARTPTTLQMQGIWRFYTGPTLYADIEGLVRGDLAQRETLQRFERWIGETFFKGEQVALIPRKGQSTLTVKIGDEHEQPIHNLGDGIQAVLILAFPLFAPENEHLLVFIEEPELFLHPWLQRVLLETLSNRFPHHQYFLTTHSNHFLDLTLDIESVSVFAFEKRLDENGGRERPGQYRVTNVSRSDCRPLELLGVRNSSVLLTNCTISVQGITDRRYIAHWLELYQQHIQNGPSSRAKFFKEDLHYSFVEYSGGNITHWSFLA